MSKKGHRNRRRRQRPNNRHLLSLQRTRKTKHYLLSSGKKEFDGFLKRTLQTSRKHDRECTFVVSDTGERCRSKSQECHALSKGRIVNLLAGENEKVVDFSWGFPEWGRVFLPSSSNKPVSLWSEKWFEPHYTGKNEATTTGFACNLHDNNAFKDLDAATSIDQENRALVFQAAYRALLYANSRLRQVYRVFDYDDLKKRVFRYRLLNQLPHLKSQRDLLETANKSVRSEVNRLGKIHYLYEDNLDSIPIALTSQTQLFRSKLRFASTGPVDSTDTFQIILPDNDDPELHQLTIIQIEREGIQSQEAHKILSLAEQCSEDSTDWIALFQQILFTGNCTIASIGSYEKLSEADTFLIKSALRGTTRAAWMERLFQEKQ